MVANFGVGHDNIDLEAARARGVRVTNTPDVLTNATAELAVALMLATARRIAAADALVRRGEWRGSAPERLLGRELSGAAVGLVGLGRIARRVARAAARLRVRLLATSRAGDDGSGSTEVLGRADFVSLHVPLTPETRHLIDARALARMRRGAILVNTSRGAVVDTRRADRRAALGPARRRRAGRLRGRAARSRGAARAAQYRAAAAHRLGHGLDPRRDGAAVRRERDRRARGSGASVPGRMTGDFSAEQFEALFRQVSTWGRWGAGDERGALHHLTPEHVVAAAPRSRATA